jgi:hypothetical protein
LKSRPGQAGPSRGGEHRRSVSPHCGCQRNGQYNSADWLRSGAPVSFLRSLWHRAQLLLSNTPRPRSALPRSKK